MNDKQALTLKAELLTEKLVFDLVGDKGFNHLIEGAADKNFKDLKRRWIKIILKVMSQ